MSGNTNYGIRSAIEKMYSKGGLPSSLLFPDGWLNFGYWLEASTQNISLNERISASKRLYSKIFTRMKPASHDRVLEVGCGQGNGCFLLKEMHPDINVFGIDASPDQIESATGKAWVWGRPSEASVSFSKAIAESIPFESEYFAYVYSVEAVQHFRSLEAFASEAFRILKYGGSLCLTTIFANRDADVRLLHESLPTVKAGIDILHDELYVLDVLRRQGFYDIKIERIGSNVFRPFSQWIRENLGPDSWGLNWYRAYEDGAIDYLIITAKK